MIECASDEVISGPRLCTLGAWQWNVRAYLEYLCQCDIALIEEQGGNRIWTDALRRYSTEII